MPNPAMLELVQSLPTSGARAVAAFDLAGGQYLALPQLACDILGAEAGMNLGDSDVPLLLYRRNAHGNSAYELFQELPVPGGEDAEFFSIEDRYFLATASLRSGKGPYTMDVDSTIFEWDGTRFVDFQHIPTFAAKQWRYFQVEGRHFLALAQGVEIPGLSTNHPTESTIYEWDGSRFTAFQTVSSKWGYNWLHFQLDGHHFLAYADHLLPSVILRWNGSDFDEFQQLEGTHGRAFCFLRSQNGTPYLAFSRISSDSLLYRWDGKQFQIHHTMEGPGGRELASVEYQGARYLIHIKFVTGSRADPKPEQESVIYRIENDGLQQVLTFPTLGGTDVTIIPYEDHLQLVVSESLTASIRFRTDTHIYCFRPNHPADETAPTSAPRPYQSPEFLRLFTAYTASSTSIGALLTSTVTRSTSSCPLLVATSFDLILFPGGGKAPSHINFRLANRGFKELAAISHLGPALASLVKINDIARSPETWIPFAQELLDSIKEVEKVNSPHLWCDLIAVEAFRDREVAIVNMVAYACRTSRRFLELVMANPTKLTSSFLRDQYLEATGEELGATVPFNAVMIATFFLVGLDTSYRMRRWFEQYDLDWENAMVLVTGRQGRETSGVTIGTSSVAQMILQASDLRLPTERLYLAPHGPVPTIDQTTTTESLRQSEEKFRLSWNALHGMGELGATMFEGYPAYKVEQNSRPLIDLATQFVSNLPRISSPDDWFAMNTRMRLVLEDSRQLLSGCVTDYAAEQLRLVHSNLSRVVVPGLDGINYGVKTCLYPPFKASATISIASWKRPLATNLPEIPVQYFMAGDRGQLAYRINGSPQDQPIIWIHGLPLDSRSWVAQYDSFSEGFYNVFLDLRGYGDSAKLPKDVSDVTQVYCDDLAALMDHLSLPAATLVGFASGGHVALRFSGQNTQRVKSLVLLNASPCFKRQGPDYAWGFTNEQINNNFLSAARADGLQGLLRQVLDPSVVFEDLSSGDAETISHWFRGMAEKAGLDTLLGFFEHMVNDDDRHLIPLITAPTLIISSSMGKEVPAQTACYLRGRIGNSKLVEIPDADHFFHVTRPVFVNEVVRSFLSTI